MGEFLSNGYYRDDNKKVWKLALRLNKDNDEFSYDSQLWTNNTLLNDKIYNWDDISNSKYKSFIKNKTNKILIQMNGKNVVCELNENLKGKTLLDLLMTQNNHNIQGKDTKENILHQTVSPWNILRDGDGREIYNVTNFAFNVECDMSKARFGLLLNNFDGYVISGDTAGSLEGIGLYGYCNGNNFKCNSGGVYWSNRRKFISCNVFVEPNAKFLFEQNNKYYSSNEKNYLNDYYIPLNITMLSKDIFLSENEVNVDNLVTKQIGDKIINPVQKTIEKSDKYKVIMLQGSR